MCVLGGGSVHASSPGPIPTHDGAVPGLRAVAESVHTYGARLVLQLRHSGSAKPSGLGGAPWSCSPVPHPVFGIAPVPMTRAMIEEVVAGFAAAAGRARQGDLDGVEIHGASGYLVNQFLSPATNERTDAYGGVLANRLRFAMEILDAVRAEVGAEFVVGFRLTANEFVDGGLVPEEAAKIAVALQARVDYMHVAVGGPWRPDEISPILARPIRDRFRDHVRVTREVSVPTAVGGLLSNAAEADAVIANGICELVAMTRALIADPRSGYGRRGEGRAIV